MLTYYTWASPRVGYYILWYTESDSADDFESVGVNSPCGFEPGDQSGRTVQVRASPTMIIPCWIIRVASDQRADSWSPWTASLEVKAAPTFPAKRAQSRWRVEDVQSPALSYINDHPWLGYLCLPTFKKFHY